MLHAFTDILVPAADAWRPDLVLVSAGYDPHPLDLALNVTPDGFAAMTGVVQAVADRHCGGRLAVVLEGGYNLEAVASGSHATLQVLAGATPPEVVAPGVRQVAAAAAFHAPAFTVEVAGVTR
jgi:acetoin utilization deacetylase AcuC-like enzyme